MAEEKGLQDGQIPQNEEEAQDPKKRLKEMLLKSIEDRYAVFKVFKDDMDKPLNQKTTPSNPVESFLEKSPQFNNLIDFLYETSEKLKLNFPEIRNSVGELLDGLGLIEENSSDRFGIKRYDNLNFEVIKFNPRENLVKQLKQHNINLELVENKFVNHARYLDEKIPQFKLITLGNKIFNLDISKYDRDKKQHFAEGPSSGPQESSQKQHFAKEPRKGILKKSENSLRELNSSEQNSSPEKKEKKVVFQHDVKNTDGNKGRWGEWVKNTNGTNPMSSQGGPSNHSR
ncbi:MAG: hypothetical protein FJX30_05105 [Alphaproteobacteria bacterium]|nr:hypothetical protein [Alphaproteobacteria bacterium]